MKMDENSQYLTKIPNCLLRNLTPISTLLRNLNKILTAKQAQFFQHLVFKQLWYQFQAIVAGKNL
jgi:hypothetical protein